jgi:DnaJ-class molecular chaperone
MKDYYTILKVSKNSTAEEIKKAYRKLAVEFHPDRNQGDAKKSEIFREINEAYEIIGDEIKRKQYDEGGTKNKKEGKAEGKNKPSGAGMGTTSFDINDFEKRFESFFGFSKDGAKADKGNGSQKLNTDAMFNSFFKVKK